MIPSAFNQFVTLIACFHLRLSKNLQLDCFMFNITSYLLQFSCLLLFVKTLNITAQVWFIRDSLPWNTSSEWEKGGN